MEDSLQKKKKQKKKTTKQKNKKTKTKQNKTKQKLNKSRAGRLPDDRVLFRGKIQEGTSHKEIGWQKVVVFHL